MTQIGTRPWTARRRCVAPPVAPCVCVCVCAVPCVPVLTLLWQPRLGNTPGPRASHRPNAGRAHLPVDHHPHRGGEHPCQGEPEARVDSLVAGGTVTPPPAGPCGKARTSHVFDVSVCCDQEGKFTTAFFQAGDIRDIVGVKGDDAAGGNAKTAAAANADDGAPAVRTCCNCCTVARPPPGVGSAVAYRGMCR